MSKLPKLVLALALLLAGLTGCHQPPDPPTPGLTNPDGSTRSMNIGDSSGEPLPSRGSDTEIPAWLLDDIRNNRVRALIYNTQVTDALTGQLLGEARKAKVPVVGVTETEPGMEGMLKGPYVAETFPVTIDKNYVVVEVGR